MAEPAMAIITAALLPKCSLLVVICLVRKILRFAQNDIRVMLATMSCWQPCHVEEVENLRSILNPRINRKLIAVSGLGVDRHGSC